MARGGSLSAIEVCFLSGVCDCEGMGWLIGSGKAACWIWDLWVRRQVVWRGKLLWGRGGEMVEFVGGFSFFFLLGIVLDGGGTCWCWYTVQK